MELILGENLLQQVLDQSSKLAGQFWEVKPYKEEVTASFLVSGSVGMGTLEVMVLSSKHRDMIRLVKASAAAQEKKEEPEAKHKESSDESEEEKVDKIIEEVRA